MSLKKCTDEYKEFYQLLIKNYIKKYNLINNIESLIIESVVYGSLVALKLLLEEKSNNEISEIKSKFANEELKTNLKKLILKLRNGTDNGGEEKKLMMIKNLLDFYHLSSSTKHSPYYYLLFNISNIPDNLDFMSFIRKDPFICAFKYANIQFLNKLSEKVGELDYSIFEEFSGKEYQNHLFKNCSSMTSSEKLQFIIEFGELIKKQKLKKEKEDEEENGKKKKEKMKKKKRRKKKKE